MYSCYEGDYISGSILEDRELGYLDNVENKLHHLAKDLESQLADSESRVRKAHKDVYAEWLMLCGSQQQLIRKETSHSSNLIDIPLKDVQKDTRGLLQDVKEDIIDYVSMTHKNITAMKEFSSRFFQKVESSLSSLQLEIYQDEKGSTTIENELNDLSSVTKEWTTKTITYFKNYEKVFRTIPMEKAIERIRAKYGSMAQLRAEIGQALTPSNLFQYTVGGFGPLGTSCIILACTIGFSNPIGIGVVIGSAILGALICGGIYLYHKHTKNQKIQELERLQAILNRFSSQFESLGNKIDTAAFKALLDILRNIETNTKEFEAVFLPYVDSSQSEDEYDVCTICHEHFSLEEGEEKKGSLQIQRVAPQSCAQYRSHHCHSTCLASWEKTKAPLKQCPTCRREYKRVVIIQSSI